jgi:hypothetical protein
LIIILSGQITSYGFSIYLTCATYRIYFSNSNSVSQTQTHKTNTILISFEATLLLYYSYCYCYDCLPCFIQKYKYALVEIKFYELKKLIDVKWNIILSVTSFFNKNQKIMISSNKINIMTHRFYIFFLMKTDNFNLINNVKDLTRFLESKT